MHLTRESWVRECACAALPAWPACDRMAAQWIALKSI